jgi:hypothetical protein
LANIKQAHTFERLRRRGAHAHVAGDHGDLGLKVDAEVLAGHDHVVAGPDEVVAAALVHQRVAVKTFGHFGVARLAHQLHMVDEGRAVGPLVGARQRRHAARGLEGKGVARLALVQRFIQVLQLRRHEVPVVQHLLQFAGDAGRIMGRGKIARHHDELAVA